MQYILLIYSDPSRGPAYGTPEFNEMIEGYSRATERMKADGVLRNGEWLQGAETAVSLRINGGRVETMDGPFAETREHLGGLYVIDVPDLDAALNCASMIPTSEYGTIELRPIMVYG